MLRQEVASKVPRIFHCLRCNTDFAWRPSVRATRTDPACCKNCKSGAWNIPRRRNTASARRRNPVTLHHCLRCDSDFPSYRDNPNYCLNCKSRVWNRKRIEIAPPRDRSPRPQYPHECQRCRCTWVSCKAAPKTCRRCNTPYWNEPSHEEESSPPPQIKTDPNGRIRVGGIFMAPFEYLYNQRERTR